MPYHRLPDLVSSVSLSFLFLFLPCSSLSSPATISFISFLPFSGRRHNMTHKGEISYRYFIFYSWSRHEHLGEPVTLYLPLVYHSKQHSQLRQGRLPTECRQRKRNKYTTLGLLQVGTRWEQVILTRCRIGHAHVTRSFTVDSRYLELQGTPWNISRYPYFDIPDLRNLGKTINRTPAFNRMNM